MCVNALTCRCGGGSEWLKEKDEISSKFVSNSESCDYGSFLLRRKFIFFLKLLTSKVPSPQRHVNTSTCVVNKHRLRLRLETTTGARDVLEPQVFFFFIESRKGPNDGLSVVWAVGVRFLLFIFYHPANPLGTASRLPTYPNVDAVLWQQGAMDRISPQRSIDAGTHQGATDREGSDRETLVCARGMSASRAP